MRSLRRSAATSLLLIAAAAHSIRVDPPALPRRAASSGARNFAPQSESPLPLQRRGALQLAAAAALAPALAPTTAAASDAAPALSWLPMARYGSSASLGAGAYPEAFVMYLARFLLRFDSSSSAWWRSKLASLPAGWSDARAQAELRALVGSLGASLAYGLAPFAAADAAGAAALWRKLSAAYGAQAEAPAQLALMFSLLAADRQPADMMRAALPSSASKEQAPAAASAADAAEAARAALAAAADALPPAAVLRPVWDDAARAYVPPAALLADGAFGQLARAPVSREPALGAETCAAAQFLGGNSDARNSVQLLTAYPSPFAGTRCSPRAAASGAR